MPDLKNIRLTIKSTRPPSSAGDLNVISIQKSTFEWVEVSRSPSISARCTVKNADTSHDQLANVCFGSLCRALHSGHYV